MKVLFAGDTHGDSYHIRRILKEADEEGCDAVFQVGDFGYWEHKAEGVEFINQVAGYAWDLALPLYFLDGNHDKTSLLLEKYQERDVEGFIQLRDYLFYAPRGHRWTWGHRKFIALGGAYSVDKAWRLDLEYKNHLKLQKRNVYRAPSNQLSTDTSGTLWFPEEQMTDNDMDTILLTDSSPVDVIVAHDKPRAANPGWNRKDYLECYPNQDRLQKAVRALQPSLFVHGHLHYRYTDKILCDDDKWTTVVGLDANGHASTSGKFASSYMIFDLSEFDTNKCDVE